MKLRISKKILGGVIAVFLTIFFGFKLMLINSDAYVASIKYMQQNDEVLNCLGSDFKVGFWVTGSVSQMGNRSIAMFILPLKGPKNNGRAEVELNKRSGEWLVQKLNINLENGGEIIIK